MPHADLALLSSRSHDKFMAYGQRSRARLQRCHTWETQRHRTTQRWQGGERRSAVQEWATAGAGVHRLRRRAMARRVPSRVGGNKSVPPRSDHDDRAESHALLPAGPQCCVTTGTDAMTAFNHTSLGAPHGDVPPSPRRSPVLPSEAARRLRRGVAPVPAHAQSQR